MDFSCDGQYLQCDSQKGGELLFFDTERYKGTAYMLSHFPPDSALLCVGRRSNSRQSKQSSNAYTFLNFQRGYQGHDPI